MSKTLIVNLVGASGSGKSSIARELEQQGYNVIQSYTTREPRCEDEWGHRFVNGWLDKEDRGFWTESGILAGLIPWDKIIAYFNSYKSGNHYFATDDQVLRGKTNIYVVDPKGAEMVCRFYDGTDINVVTIYLNVDESIRAKRLLTRVENKAFAKLFADSPIKCPEVYYRIMPDREIFSKVKSDYVIDGNRDIRRVVRDMINTIWEVQHGRRSSSRCI